MVMREKVCKFYKNKRAVWSLLLFSFIFILSLFSNLIANDKPLIVKYNNQILFPTFQQYSDKFFGGDFPTVADYKDKLIINNINQNGWMIMPIIPYSYNTVDYMLETATPSAPDKNHWLGTDEEGRDVLARILYGIRLSVIFAFLLTAVSSLIGIFIGAVQGYFGGKVDLILQRFIAAIVYINHHCQCFFADILEFIGNFTVVFLDGLDIHGACRIFAVT